MNAQNAREYMPLVQALANGLTIQKDLVGKWTDSKEIHFDMKPEFYRIKPEPRTFEMWLTPEGAMYSIEEIAERRIEGWEHITVKEVVG